MTFVRLRSATIARTMRNRFLPSPTSDSGRPAIVPPAQGLLQAVFSSPERRAYVPGSIVATWVTAFAFVAILTGGWLHTHAAIERHLSHEVAAMTQLAAERSARVLEQAKLAAESPAPLQDTFAKAFNSDFPAEGDIVALYDMSGQLVASFPASRAPSGLILPHADDTNDGVAYHTSPTGDGTHLVGTRRLPRHPFRVAYGKNVDAQLADWQLQRAILALATIVALIVTATISGGIQRRLALTAQLQKVHSELKTTNSALRGALAASELIAARDQLTGLFNRRSFDQRLDEAIAHATRHSGTFSLLLIDIDNFKSINDRYGHIVGDEVLRRFAEALHERLRQNDVAARWGGEEFVILADGASLENACQLGEQIRAAIKATTFPRLMEVTASIGVTAHGTGDTSDTLLSRADQALYEAKRNGRDRVVAAGSAEQGRFFFTDRATGPSLFP
jgi:diguanylate cyclase (GGDEF)-like protein